jgi:hypothetical protein
LSLLSSLEVDKSASEQFEEIMGFMLETIEKSAILQSFEIEMVHSLLTSRREDKV